MHSAATSSMVRHMTTSRQTHLDALRGLAAVIVVFVHYCCAFFPYAVFGSKASYHRHLPLEEIFFYPPFGLLVAGYFAVCLFFILSGYVLSYPYLGEPSQRVRIIAAIIKRPIRLGGLVWFTILCPAILWSVGYFSNGAVADLTGSRPWFRGFWPGEFNPHKFFINFTTSAFSKGTIYNPPLWSIKIELYGSILVFLFLLLLGNFKYRLVVASVLILLCKDSLYQGFWIGLLIADVMKHHRHRLPIKLTGVGFYLLLVAFIFLSSYPHYVDHSFIEKTIYGFLPDDQGFGGGYPMLSALLCFILVVSNSRIQRYLQGPMFQFVGAISYGLYVVHFLVLGSLSSAIFVVLRDHLGHAASFVIVFLSGMAFVGFAAYLSTRYIDSPCISFANRISHKVTQIAGFNGIGYPLRNG